MLLFFSNSDIIPCGVNCLVKIVWDWNGTLLNDVDLCFSCINRLLVSHDLKPLDTLSQYREVFTFPIEDYYKRVGFDFDKIPFSMLAHEYMEDYQEKSYACDLHSDVLDVVNKAKNLGFSQTVLSASKMDYLLKQMETLHVDDLFDSICGINDIYAKSKVELAHAFKQTCSLDDEIYFVGDSVHDYEVAKSIGAKCILVTTGHQNRATLESVNVPVMDSLMESLDLIYERD